VCTLLVPILPVSKSGRFAGVTLPQMLHDSLEPVAATIGFATITKVPICSTHAIGGAFLGGGATRGWHAVRWIWGEKIVVAWVITVLVQR
jgi:hypothetical protein